MAGRTARRRITRIAAPADPPRNGPASNRQASNGQASNRQASNGQAAGLSHRSDLLAVEEPLEIRVNGRPLAVTMRTPGDDIDLAAGFLASEGVVAGASDIAEIRICGEAPEPGNVAPGNVAEVRLAVPAGLDDDRLRRNFLTTSACGVCGKTSIDAIRTRARHDVAADRVRVRASVLARLPGTLRDAQRIFARTGGLHAAGLFAADGTLLALREDVGRHNAVDKVAGWALREGRLPLSGRVLLVSGRASFELVQKALMAGIPVVAAVSAPSSLAAELAEEAGQTLAGFLRGSSMNIYAGAERIDPF
ncbi:MAG TPA: formate dehydrogenase accessory sulfurtransferase FdhD [Streptosporangiaceae bacterium]|nr:formate dehydrogenase accessory sulfurtransferase FdhD [Streptosporangiaceae bacterium]